MKRVAIVGSSDFPVVHAGPAIFEWLGQTFPIHDTTIYTRGSKGFDLFLGEGAKYMGYPVIELPGRGGPSNYERDVKLVREVEEVHVFFSPDRVGEGGSQHLVDKALDQRKPTYSYSYIPGRVSGGGHIELIGSDDGEGLFDAAAGQPAQPPPQPREAPPQRAGQGERGAPVWADDVGDLPF